MQPPQRVLNDIVQERAHGVVHALVPRLVARPLVRPEEVLTAGHRFSLDWQVQDQGCARSTGIPQTPLDPEPIHARNCQAPDFGLLLPGLPEIL
eukprot:10943385-Alexandrium_andersonii.AAC.1